MAVVGIMRVLGISSLKVPETCIISTAALESFLPVSVL